MSRAWKERPISTFFATGLGIGMIPWAPGTWGSAEGLLFAWLLARRLPHGFHWFSRPRIPLVIEAPFCDILLLATLVAIAGIFCSGRTEAVCEDKDPGPVVVDEVVGQLIASAPASLAALHGRWWLWLLSLALFRLFDIWKPGPIRKLQELPGGWGIMLDDVAAGILAGALTYGIGRSLWAL